MKISKLFHHYHLPFNLQQHIYWVTAVGKHITDHWTGPKIDKESIIQTLLLHDLGNLIKYDFSDGATILDESLDKNYWKPIQKELKNRYGSNNSNNLKGLDITTQMLLELKIDKKIVKLIGSMNASGLQKAYKSGLELQICEYADMRVAPWGIVPLKKRLKDLKKRYSNLGHTWANDELFDNNAKFGEKIEQRLQKHTSVNILSIPKPEIEHYLVELPQHQIDISPWTSLAFRIKHSVKPLSRSRK